MKLLTGVRGTPALQLISNFYPFDYVSPGLSAAIEEFA